MNCPVCNIQLMMADRQGVEINYCPTCRGVWIDRGGLDKIIDRSGAYTANASSKESERDYDRHDRHERQDSHDRHHDSEGRHRKSFLSSLFD